MAYATISVRFVYFITGTADKESWEGCHGHICCIYICSSSFNYIWGLFYYAQGTGAAGRKCTIDINERHASGFEQLAILESVYGRSAPVLLGAVGW